ncbi:MAG: PKD domain-containing protein [Anaerolineae bacterium]|nr:PKD domain-containing protein [Anaerolineae bacterium]
MWTRTLWCSRRLRGVAGYSAPLSYTAVIISGISVFSAKIKWGRQEGLPHTYRSLRLFSLYHVLTVPATPLAPWSIHNIYRVQTTELNPAPATSDAPLAYAGPDRSTDEVTSVSFPGVITTTDTPTGHTLAWDFGDGTTASGTLTPTHIYGDNGTYTVTLTVTDTMGLSAADGAVVAVGNVVPSVSVWWLLQP